MLAITSNQKLTSFISAELYSKLALNDFTLKEMLSVFYELMLFYYKEITPVRFALKVDDNSLSTCFIIY